MTRKTKQLCRNFSCSLSPTAILSQDTLNNALGFHTIQRVCTSLVLCSCTKHESAKNLTSVSLLRSRFLGLVSRKSRKLFGPEKPFVKLLPAYSVKLVFSYVVKGIKIKITAKSRASRRLRFEDTKTIMSPEMHPKSFGTFEKRAPGYTKMKRMHNLLSVPLRNGK